MTGRLNALFAAVLLCLPVWAQETAAPQRPKYKVDATTDEIKVDGALTESVWQKPPTFTLDYETSPGDNIPAAVKTEMWITYNRSHLYVAARAQDPDPSAVRARLTDRDRAFQDDFIGVVLDTFNDERRAYEFFVNPLGVQMDLLQSDVTGNEDDSWDAIWDSSGHVTSTGYEVEIAIPFSSLRFPESHSPGIWGIDALRIRPREQRYRIGLNQLPRGRNCYLCNESKLEGFDGIKPGRNIELDPTLTGHQIQQKDDLAESFNSDHQFDPGISARWGITPGITLNGAINPDFSQVEADSAQLTVNTQFAIFYPEKRPFFLEGADFFDTKINAIYTRDIADPSWGIKTSGKQGKSAFGIIFSRDDVTNFIFPSSQSTDLGSLAENNTSTVLRYRYDLGSGSTAGGLFTSRQGAGYHNQVFGGDTLLRWGSEAVRVEFLGSTTGYPQIIQEDFNQPSGTLLGTAVRAVYEHSTRHWTGYMMYNAASDDFRADLGFIPQVGYHRGYGFIEHYWFSDHNEHWWRRLTIGSETTWTYDRQGNPLQQQYAPYILINGPYQFFVNVFAALGPSYYYGQRFDRNAVGWFWEMRPSSWIYVNLEGRVGQEIDYENARQGDIVRLLPGVRFDLARSLRLEYYHSFEHLNVEGGELYHANISEVRAIYQFSTRTFMRLITQYIDVNRNPDLYTYETNAHDQALFNQLLFSYKVNPQVVLFLGYSDNYFNSPQQQLSLTQANRTLFFKVGYAWVK